MTITSHSSPSAWRGGRPPTHLVLSALLLLILLMVLVGATAVALLAGHRIELASVPYLHFLWTLHGG